MEIKVKRKRYNNGTEEHSNNRSFKVSTYSYGSMGKKWLYLYQLTRE